MGELGRKNAPQPFDVYRKDETYNKTEINNLPTASFKNKLINGGFDVWQRGETGLGGTDGFKADRWKITGGAEITNMYKAMVSDGIESFNAMTFTKGALAGTSYFTQTIENPRLLSGKTMTQSFKAFSNTGYPMTASFYVETYNPTDGIVNIYPSQAFSWNDDWSVRTYTFTVPALGANFDDPSSWIRISLTNTGETTGAYLAQVQLEEGSIATPFENRPIGVELALCQRYYEKFSFCIAGYGAVGASNEVGVDFKVVKRITPSLTYEAASVANCVVYDIRSATLYGCRVHTEIAVTGGYYFSGPYGTADAEL